jgi:hypothetical protein
MCIDLQAFIGSNLHKIAEWGEEPRNKEVSRNDKIKISKPFGYVCTKKNYLNYELKQ